MPNQTPEQIARDNIDRQLVACGWVVQPKGKLDLNQALGVAVREYQTDAGPADYVLFVDKKPVGVIEAKKSKRFAWLLLIIETGLRPSEYLGLKWTDIDFDKGCLSVNRVVTEKSKGGFYFGETKTARSRRKLPLSDTVVNSLKAHRRNQLEERFKIGKDYQNLDIVFASEIGTPLRRRNLIKRHFKPLLKEAGLPDITLYELRHTTATLLLSAGENPKIVSERLGHASVVLTLDTYSHVLPNMQEEATQKLQNIFQN